MNRVLGSGIWSLIFKMRSMQAAIKEGMVAAVLSGLLFGDGLRDDIHQHPVPLNKPSTTP
ncbi:hypothetical protein O9929_27700 [Vibrio lentus]|nr:hypothetical protein [Vibrio lentus]